MQQGQCFTVFLWCSNYSWNLWSHLASAEFILAPILNAVEKASLWEPVFGGGILSLHLHELLWLTLPSVRVFIFQVLSLFAMPLFLGIISMYHHPSYPLQTGHLYGERLLASPLPKEISPFSKCYTHPVSNPHVTFIYCLVFLGCMYIPTNCQLLQRSDSVSSVSFKALLVKEQLSKMLNWLQLLP